MRNSFFRASLFLLVVMPAIAAAQPFPPYPPPPPPPVQTPPLGCVDAHNSADYVPGVDARGRPVAPADAPDTVDVQISTEVYAELRSPNPQLRGVGVSANLAGLATRPPCPPKPPRRNQPKH